MRRPKKRGAGCDAPAPQKIHLTGENLGVNDSLFQGIHWDDCSYHPSVKAWGKANWLTEEFETHLSKSNNPSKDEGEL